MTPFRSGVNYWPARTGMRWWRQFSADAVAADLLRIGVAGGDSVRVFLRWEDFQPEPDRVNSDALRDLVGVADAAAAAGLLLIPTLFTGHMSGANWLPRWATRPGSESGRFPIVTAEAYAPVAARNWFTDEDVTRAQELLARETAAALRGHPALWAWDLGNENSNVCIPTTHDQARVWLSRMTTAIRRADPACRVTIGLHMEDLEQDRRLGPAEAAEACDFLCMHGYPLYASWARRTTDPQLPAFLAEVTRWLGGGKELFFEEFGMPTPTRDDEAAADVYIGAALDALYEVGVTGGMVWCYTDYDASLWQQPPFDVAPHERFFGLWRADGTTKPAARHLARYRDVQVREPRAPAWIDADPTRYYDAPLDTLRGLYARYVHDAVAAR